MTVTLELHNEPTEIYEGVRYFTRRYSTLMKKIRIYVYFTDAKNESIAIDAKRVRNVHVSDK